MKILKKAIEVAGDTVCTFVLGCVAYVIVVWLVVACIGATQGLIHKIDPSYHFFTGHYHR